MEHIGSTRDINLLSMGNISLAMKQGRGLCRCSIHTLIVIADSCNCRYWARSFMGWPTIENAKPNKAHMAIARLGTLKLTHGTITQSKLADSGTLKQLLPMLSNTDGCRCRLVTSLGTPKICNIEKSIMQNCLRH